MALPLFQKSAALAGRVNNSPVECDFSKQPDKDWRKPSMVRVQTCTYKPLRYLPALKHIEVNM